MKMKKRLVDVPTKRQLVCRSSQYSHTQTPDSYLDRPDQQSGLAGRAVEALRLHPVISLALILVLLLQVNAPILFPSCPYHGQKHLLVLGLGRETQ